MNKIWAKNFEGFLIERAEKELESFRQHDKKFADLKGKRAMLSLRSGEILRMLTDDERKTLEDYQETAMLLCQMEKEQVYRQGYIDCVKLVQYLKLWEAFA